MVLNYTGLLLRSATKLMRYDKKVTFHHFVTKSIPSFITVRGRSFSDEPKDLYSVLNEDDFEGEVGSDHTEVNLEEIADGNPETLRLLKIYQLEMDLLTQKTGKVPNKITESQWRNLLSLDSKSRRMSRVFNLWRRENFKIEKKLLQDEKRKKLEELKSNNPIKQVQLSTNSPINYGLMETALFHRFYPQNMRKLYNFRVLQAMMFGPHIIVDCGYDKYMSLLDIGACVEQLVAMWLMNRENFNPFDVIFCNLNTDSILYSKLLEVLPAIEEDPTCPFNFTNKNYLDLYPKERLVYLTPDAPDLLDRYDHDSIYIIGGIPNAAFEKRSSLAKAKIDGLRMAKFPIDKYLKWGAGNKILTIDQCLGIMTDLKNGGDWKLAFRHIPSWKLKQLNGSSNYDNNKIKTNLKTSRHFKKPYKQQSAYENLLEIRKINWKS